MWHPANPSIPSQFPRAYPAPFPRDAAGCDEGALGGSIYQGSSPLRQPVCTDPHPSFSRTATRARLAALGSSHSRTLKQHQQRWWQGRTNLTTGWCEAGDAGDGAGKGARSQAQQRRRCGALIGAHVVLLQIDCKPSVPQGQQTTPSRSRKIFVGGLAPETTEGAQHEGGAREGGLLPCLLCVPLGLPSHGLSKDPCTCVPHVRTPHLNTSTTSILIPPPKMHAAAYAHIPPPLGLPPP